MYLYPYRYFFTSETVQVTLSASLEDRYGLSLDGNGDGLGEFDLATDSGFRLADSFITGHPDNYSYFFITDSVPLRVIRDQLEPRDSASGVALTSRLRIAFNYGVDSASLDTARYGNRSVYATSSFHRGEQLPFRSLSVRGNHLEIRMDRNFFATETVTVSLAASIQDTFGNSLDGNYDGHGSFMLDFPDTNFRAVDSFPKPYPDNFTYSFLMGAGEFYTFPNPYKPNRIASHREHGGITFKNLNRLPGVDGRNGLQIRIYTVDGDLVYATPAGQPIRFWQGDSSRAAEWTWPAVNRNGAEVASGLYLYVIASRDGAAIYKKEKLLIVR
jgi:hypothetical protein